MLQERAAARWQAGQVGRGADTVAVEAVCELFIDAALVSRTVVSPSLLAEWGAGHAICEGWIEAADITSVAARDGRVLLTSRAGVRSASRLVQQTSGYLGREGAALPQPVSSDIRIAPESIEAWAAALSERATGWRQTGGLHVALLCEPEGRILALAEDVGRHNALDKVVGHAHLAGLDRSRCVVVVSGRMPQGMVVKAARAGIPVVVTKAASTDLGIDCANALNLTLICFARSNRFTVYSGEERVLL